MAWWVSVTPEVVRGVEPFGFKDPPPDKILESVEHSLAHYGETWAGDRWDKCPADFFVYTHLFIEGGRAQALVFVVDDTSAAVGVRRLVWIEHHPGGLISNLLQRAGRWQRRHGLQRHHSGRLVGAG